MRYVLIFFVALCVATILSGCPGTTSSPDIDSEQATTNPPTETNRIEDPEPIPTTPHRLQALHQLILLLIWSLHWELHQQ